MLKLVEKGLQREEAYQIVQSNAMAAWNKNDGSSFHKNLLADERVTKLVTNDEIEACFSPETYLKNIDAVFTRLGV